MLGLGLGGNLWYRLLMHSLLVCLLALLLVCLLTAEEEEEFRQEVGGVVWVAGLFSVVSCYVGYRRSSSRLHKIWGGEERR